MRDRTTEGDRISAPVAPSGGSASGAYGAGTGDENHDRLFYVRPAHLP